MVTARGLAREQGVTLPTGHTESFSVKVNASHHVPREMKDLLQRSRRRPGSVRWTVVQREDLSARNGHGFDGLGCGNDRPHLTVVDGV